MNLFSGLKGAGLWGAYWKRVQAELEAQQEVERVQRQWAYGRLLYNYMCACNEGLLVPGQREPEYTSPQHDSAQDGPSDRQGGCESNSPFSEDPRHGGPEGD